MGIWKWYPRVHTTLHRKWAERGESEHASKVEGVRETRNTWKTRSTEVCNSPSPMYSSMNFPSKRRDCTQNGWGEELNEFKKWDIDTASFNIDSAGVLLLCFHEIDHNTIILFCCTHQAKQDACTNRFVSSYDSATLINMFYVQKHFFV